MNYDEPEFLTLMEAVEGQGGEHLDSICSMRTYTPTGRKAGRYSKPFTRPGCGQSALFVVPYDDGTHVPATIKVCAVDDDMGRWPRFGGDRFAAPEHFIPFEEE